MSLVSVNERAQIEKLFKKAGWTQEDIQLLEQAGGYLGRVRDDLRRHMEETFSGLAIRQVTVNRGRSPQEMLDATLREQYIHDGTAVRAMPRGEAEEVEVVFFRVGRPISDYDLELEFRFRDLKSADPYSIAALNEAEPFFADEKPHGTHWKDADGNWCRMEFCRRYGIRSARVYSCKFNTGAWRASWWFAGVRK